MEGRSRGGAGGVGRRLWMISSAFNLFVWRWVGARGVDKVPTSGMLVRAGLFCGWTRTLLTVLPPLVRASGMLGIMWALHSCASVDTYGFGPLPPCLEHAGAGPHRERHQVCRHPHQTVFSSPGNPTDYSPPPEANTAPRAAEESADHDRDRDTDSASPSSGQYRCLPVFTCARARACASLLVRARTHPRI